MTATFDSHIAAQPLRRRSQRSLWRWIALAWAAHRERRSLAGLDPVLLEDIGLSRREALDEAKRPFWDVPAYWR